MCSGSGLLIAFQPTIASGFTSLQTDPGDTLLNHYILEHTWKCLTDSHYSGTLWSPPCFFPVQGTLAYSGNPPRRAGVLVVPNHIE